MKTTVINQALMKEKNQRLVAYTLWRNSPISRTGLAKKTGLNKATITNIIADLTEGGMVKCCGSLQGNVGRAQNLIMFNEEYGMCGSIIIRPNTIFLAVGNLRARTMSLRKKRMLGGNGLQHCGRRILQVSCREGRIGRSRGNLHA